MVRTTKYIKSVFLSLLVLMLPTKAKSTEITAIDFLGNPIGQVISTGMVISSDGQNVGSITADSLIINADGAVIGGVVPQGVVIGNDNRFLGKVYSDGIVRSFSGKEVGKALPNGLVIDDGGNLIGSVLYPGLVYSPDGNTIGRFTGSGIYTNLDGQRIGFVSANGYAYKKLGEEHVLDGRLISSRMVVSNEGKFIGSVAPTGRVMDFDGKDIGSLHANGFAYNNAGKIIGGLVTTKYAFNQTGKYVGIVTYNGEVKSGETTVGYYRPDGNIVNSNGEVFGYAIDIAATANDNYGQYLGYLIPNGQIVRGNEVVGILGAHGYVYDKEGKKIGSITVSGVVYDALAKFRGQALKSGEVVSVNGSLIGYMKGNKAFDANGTLIGGVLEGNVAYRDNNVALGAVNIDASVKSGSEKAKVSPFSYVFDKDGKIIGGNYKMDAIYSVNGLMYSYINPNGELYRVISDTKLTQNGILYNKKGYLGSVLNPLYIEEFNGDSLGRITQGNIVLNNKGEIAYKVLPSGYVVETKDVNSSTMAPIKGFYSNKIIALSTGGDLIGYADTDGSVIDLNNKIYGRVVYNDYVQDNNNIISGKMVPFASVVNEKCSSIGIINGRGDIINGRDVIIGHLMPNGQAVSDVGSYIGYSVFYNGLIDYDGNFSGTVNSGTGIDSSGKILGCVNKKGQVEDADNKIRYGVIIPSPVIDFENNIIGNVVANGEIVNGKDQIIGYIQPDGNAVSKTKKNLGNAMRYKVAFDNDNIFLGMVQNSGQVMNSEGKNVGQVYFDGSVYKNGNQIGYALYDFYVYDENFVTYGYLTKDGTVLSVVGSKLGQMDRGFVLDRKNQVVARGNRDYIVRDLSNNVVGELQLDGTVINTNGQNIGYLSEAGTIRDANGNEIARATPFQYYVIGERSEAPVLEESGKRSGFEPDYGGKVRINEIPSGEKGKKTSVDDKTKEPQVQRKFGDRVVGIALNPDGDIIGNIYEDDSVKDDDGNQIGFRTPDGVIVDMNYSPIGLEEVKHTNIGEMFIPENAFGNGNAYGIGNQPTNLGPGGGYGQGERYDPHRANALAQLQAARRSNIAHGQIHRDESKIKVSSFTGYEENGWPNSPQGAISSWRVDMSEMILEDKPIPAVLARSVYAGEDFSAGIPLTAIVERNVYAEEGRNIIIPAGSRVIGDLAGEGDSGGNSGGAVKIAISWRRLIRPDGSQFAIGGSTTADAQGRAGAIGYLDEQLLKKYSMPLLTSMLQNATAYIMASGSGSTNTDTSSTTDARSAAAEDARRNFISQMDQIFQEILQKKADIKAITYIPAGTRIIIFPKQDLWLNSEERDKKRGNDGGGSGYSEKGLASHNPEQEMGTSVTYSGNYQENVTPVSGNKSGSQQISTGRGPTGYNPPPSTGSTTQPPVVPESSSGGSDGVPELI
ncbi:MAG: TrbI/VirB10 family protein [Alphaproteobacteria bacterium]|nr:TrbI/VirB10 family protein [Alphaproteobacteria bacterium]